MKLKYLQENQIFELVEGSRKSKASTFDVLVVVVLAAARFELRSPSFQSNFKGFWRYLEGYLQFFRVSPTFH